MNKIVTPKDIKKRVDGSLSEDEVEELIDEYMEIGDTEKPNSEILKKIIEKEREVDKMRVSAFKLNEDQYDAILEYFRESDGYSVNQSSGGGELVRYVLDEFIQMID